MNLTQIKLTGVLLIEPKIFGDAHDCVLETWNRDRYLVAGFSNVEFIQGNIEELLR
jgi:dTDP-4-dehydrorhamnose 3,5-epimerase